MAVQLQKQLATSVTCHAWNKDRTKVAFCPNNSTVEVWAKSGAEWSQEAVLRDHDRLVTGIDWAPNTNRILTCGQDRNAFVWTHTAGKWEPVLVLLRVNRAATSCKWSPNENKFAVTCGAKLVSICYFDTEGDWWVSKNIKKHRSTVVAVAWHPNNNVVATASTDFRCRVFSAAIKQAGDKKDMAPFDLKPFGEPLHEFDACAGWVKSVAFSPSGARLAFVAHDSSITVAECPSFAATTVRFAQLPMKDIVFVGEDAIVGAGYACVPSLFQCAGGAWKFVKDLDSAGEVKQSGAVSAMDKFKTKDTTGTTAKDQKLGSKHQNTITTVRAHGADTFSTSGIDGQLVVWSRKALGF